MTEHTLYFDIYIQADNDDKDKRKKLVSYVASQVMLCVCVRMCVLSLALHTHIYTPIENVGIVHDFHLWPDMCNVYILILSVWTQITI